ncbi:MAG: hypothetical protein QOI31_1722 [Solirubrobacterales bacterium]|jgi:hypothetical protein|nr:hypothetical protein [Solirubrobacterales bacterium]
MISILGIGRRRKEALRPTMAQNNGPPYCFAGPHPSEIDDPRVIRLVDPSPMLEYWVADDDPSSRAFTRDDGPAITRENGDRVWYQDGCKHRWDGPAESGADGFEAYFVLGKRHRLGGPAVVSPGGHELIPPGEQYWIYGHRYSPSENEIVSRIVRDEHLEATERLDNETIAPDRWAELRGELEADL